MGQNPVPPVNIPIPPNIGSKMAGDFTYPKAGSQNGFDPRPRQPSLSLSDPMLFPGIKAMPWAMPGMEGFPFDSEENLRSIRAVAMVWFGCSQGTAAENQKHVFFLHICGGGGPSIARPLRPIFCCRAGCLWD